MQVQPFAPQVHTCGDQEEHMQQLALLFAEQQLAIQAADDVVAKESDKTLAVYQEAVNAQAAENKALQNENAALRARLAAMEAQRREENALQAAEAKTKEAKHAEEVAALEETNKKQQRVLDSLDKTVQDHVEWFKKCSEQYENVPGIEGAQHVAYTTWHDLSRKQHERAMQGEYAKRPQFQMINRVVYFTKE